MWFFSKKEKERKPDGEVAHYFGKIGVAVVSLKKGMRMGDKVEFRGATTNFSQTVSSMQYNHENIESAGKNDEIGMKVKKKVRVGDKIFIS